MESICTVLCRYHYVGKMYHCLQNSTYATTPLGTCKSMLKYMASGMSAYILTHFILRQSNDGTLHKRAKVNISKNLLGSVLSRLFPTLPVLIEISEGTIYLNESKYN
jgi:hypothetical protein